MDLNIIYEDNDVLVIDKPAGIIVFPEAPIKEKTPAVERSSSTTGPTLIDYLLNECPNLKNVGKPPRYGIVHRLDKDTSGVLLVAKNEVKRLEEEYQRST